jgi:uncharacterized membrane protein
MNDVSIFHPAIAVAGRVMFTLIFFASGITHFSDIHGYVALMPPSTPYPEFWVLISGAVEITGAVMIATNRYARLGGWLIFVFLVPVTVVVHGVLMVSATDPQTMRIQQSFFMKGVAMAGAALLITQLGVVRPRDPS